MSAGRPDACSRQWDGAALPATGTASAATFWVAVEQAGSWPAKAVTAFAPLLESACATAGGRALLIRHIGRHPEHDATHHTLGSRRTAYLAGGLSTPTPWLVQLALDGENATLADLPFAAMTEATPDRVLAGLPAGTTAVQAPASVLLVCTNGRRDVCCATRGREVALGAGAERHGLVWECTHIGGHRFAPTAILLPYGATYARLTVASAIDALDAGARGDIPGDLNNPTHDRGSSWLAAPDQARVSAVRHAIGETSLTALHVDHDIVTHQDGRSWQVDVTQESGPALPASCGKDAVPSTVWRGTVTAAL